MTGDELAAAQAATLQAVWRGFTRLVDLANPPPPTREDTMTTSREQPWYAGALPTFDEVRARVEAEVDAALETARSDWPSRQGPTAAQGRAFAEAVRLLGEARAALLRATDPEPGPDLDSEPDGDARCRNCGRELFTLGGDTWLDGVSNTTKCPSGRGRHVPVS